MKKRKKIKKTTHAEKTTGDDLYSLYTDFSNMKQDMESLNGKIDKLTERVEDIEIHVNLLTRLLTTLCIEKFGMRIGVLKRLIKRIEKEAIRDSQIHHLESLYKLPQEGKKGTSPSGPSKNDPWEEIS